MTERHTVWSEDQLKAAVAAAGPDAGAPAQEPAESLDSFASSLPENEADAAASATSTAGAVGEGPAASASGMSNVKTDAAAKKLNQKMAKVKRQIAEAFPKAVGTLLESKGPGWALTKEHKDMLTDSIESVFDILDVQFQIQQLNVELKSRLWVFMYPVAVLCMILGLLAAKNTEKDKPAEEKPAEGNE